MGIEKMLNALCKAMYRREYRRFTAPCDVGRVQRERLSELLKRNSDTVYGREYGFSEIGGYEEFAQRVPITVYEDYEPYIKRISEGEEQVLTAEKVRMFELTSGSSGGKKLIPYTNSLKKEFQRGIEPWLYDIYTKVDGADTGSSYWSITPVTSKKQFAPCGIPIGFEEDTEYFGAVGRLLMKRLFAVDGAVKFADDMQDFFFRTCEQLLRCRRLTLISVWNPTFLTILCDFIRDNAERLAQTLAPDRLENFLKSVAENDFSGVFPDLMIISCWADGSAADYIADIKARFPNVYLQPKGLLATECFVSFPLVGEEGSRLSIYSHFFEFRSLSDGAVVTADRLKKGKYEVIVTTSGGFYRYCIGDVIEVLEVYSDAPPRIRFLYRNGAFSDMFGEKLTEEFVRSVCTALGISDSFCLLAPCGKRYRLYTTADISSDRLDKALCESYHYNYCRQLGQLDSAEVVAVFGEPKEDYIRRLTDDGMRLGDIKPTYLSKKDGWDNYFRIKNERN